MLMKKLHLLATMKMCLLAIASSALFFSCASDGFDDESFKGTYEGFQLTSPAEESITVKASSDKLSQTISWEAINGAGTYTVSVYQGADKENVVVKDQKVKVNQITIPRIDKTYYFMTITTDENVPEGNAGATSATEYAWSTFTIDVATIASGTNLTDYFAENPIAVSYLGSDITYTLEAGGKYTMSDALNADGFVFNLICQDEENPATIVFDGPKAGFVTGSGFTLKNINIDAAASEAPFIELCKEPVAEPISANMWSTDYNLYLIEDPIAVINCNIENLNSFFLTDVKFGSNGVYFPTSVLVDNCVVHLTTAVDNTNYAYFYTNNGGGFIKELTVQNSTFYNTGAGNFRYFARYGGFGLSNVQEYFGWQDNTITYANSTFYSVCAKDGQWGNYNGIYRATTSNFIMTDCIFYNCSTSGSVPRRFLQGRAPGEGATNVVFRNNTYMKADGTFQDPQNYDVTGTNIEEDPRFADPANGNFSISGSKQATLGTGDPRWLP